jgi:hypothetical protein
VLYSTRPSLILGFHGCDHDVAERVLAGNEPLKPSENSYDWLGHGIYFWENNPLRALEYVQTLKIKSRKKIKVPSVIGAIIDLGHCLDLLESHSLEILKNAYDTVLAATIRDGGTMPENITDPESSDLLRRHLDCYVIQAVHYINKEKKSKSYDSVRGAFWEGKELYPKAGFKEKNHIQICVINPNCIKGYFRVLQHDEKFPIP